MFTGDIYMAIKKMRLKRDLRVELCLLWNTDIKKVNRIFCMNIANIYVHVDVFSLSHTRSLLVDKNYTTRLCVLESKDAERDFMIFGKKKGNHGVFNEKCKNSVFRKDDNFDYIINTSSNDEDIVLIDDERFIRNLNRKWMGL